VRILHPQRFSDAVWRLLSVFEGFWTSAVGCNAYLTPPHSQGFAPHWDDIDAFILQVRPPHDTRLSPPPPPDELQGPLLMLRCDSPVGGASAYIQAGSLGNFFNAHTRPR
jgi:hypothetical protein